MKLDWYEATIDGHPLTVLETIAKLGHELRPCDAIARKHRYRQGWAVHHNARGVVATVMAGGNGEKPHAFATSEEAEEFAALVRDQWPSSHVVTRADAAQDFNEARSFERLRRVARRVAKAKGMAFDRIEDTLNRRKGRTQYIGARTSEYRARLYEKGWEMVGKLDLVRQGRMRPEDVTTIRTPEGLEFDPANWVRLELQARPKGEEARRAAAIATPEQMWGFTDWTHQLAVEAMSLELERFFMRTRKVSKDDASLQWMVRQYGPMLVRQASAMGQGNSGWECLGLTLRDMISALEK